MSPCLGDNIIDSSRRWQQNLIAMRRGGALVLESYDERARAVAGLLERAGFEQVAVTRDLAGRDRVVEGRLPA